MKVLKQMMEFNKAAFENSYGMMATIQDQMERMVSMYVDKTSGMPDEGRKALYEWMDVYRKGCEDFEKLQSMTDSGNWMSYSLRRDRDVRAKRCIRERIRA